MFSKRVAAVAVVALAGLALGRAGMLRFQEKERAWREQCRTELQKLGITRDAAKLKYPTHLRSVWSRAAVCFPEAQRTWW